MRNKFIWLLHLIVAVFAAAGLALPAAAETPGKDGDAAINSAVIVNEYAPVQSTASSGSNSITVQALAANLPSLEAGDLVMIYQAQGATISGIDSAAYGTIGNLNSAGRYEYQTVQSVSGNTILFAGYGNTCTGLTFAYSSNGRAQVIRVPQFANLTISGAGSINARPWNGTTGGVVAVSVSAALTNNGSINANGAGFRGGIVDNLSQGSGLLVTTYRSTNPADGGEKGESIAGFQADYPNGRYGRGAPANGGGGGDSHNAGGGGGANGNNGNIWAGQGVPDTSVADWVTAWNLDPSLTPTTRNSGGGRGGYSFIFGTDPLTQAPGSTTANNRRREVGGLGGRPLNFDGTGRLFLGGGGGAGDGNNNAAGAGGRGGGLVFIMAGSSAGGGSVSANGSDGESTSPSHNDAPGGGGGGGTVVIQSGSNIGWQVTADGGDGGDQLITNTESEGPGGGGGGGVIALSGGTSVRFARGGANGETSASTMARFRPNGATRGGDGQPNLSAPSLAATPFCRRPAQVPLQITKESAAASNIGIARFALPGNERIYTITVTNPSFVIDNNSIIITDILPQDITLFTGDFGTAGSGPVQFIDGTGAAASNLICCSAAQISYSTATTGNDFSYAPNGDFDPQVLRVRVNPSGAMSEGLATPTSFSIRFRSQIK